jgi:hypothetical protein
LSHRRAQKNQINRNFNNLAKETIKPVNFVYRRERK